MRNSQAFPIRLWRAWSQINEIVWDAAPAADVERIEPRMMLTCTTCHTPELRVTPLPPAPRADLPLQPSAQAAAENLPGPFPDSQTFLLNSRPSATKVIYLDFDGDVTSGSAWRSGATVTTPAFDFEGGTSTFTANELTRIQHIWQRVAEAFSPFDINVTTQDPGAAALDNSGGGDQNYGARAVIGGNGSWFGGGGGVAYVGVFGQSFYSPAYVFSDNLFDSESNTTNAIVHELGHNLGLDHDGRTSPSEEYYDGHGSGETSWGPIMGSPYGQTLAHWSRGEYPNASNSEDDLQIITTQNGFGYRADDAGNTAATAKALSISGSGAVSVSGVIERSTDTDWYSFSTSGGAINLQINPFVRGGMLDARADLYNSAGTLLLTSNPVDGRSATLSTTLAAGTYTVRIDGVGKSAIAGHPGYTDYGSLGQYSLTGTVSGAISPARMIDDGDAGFSTTGAWTATSSGRGNDVRYAAPGTGTSVASWTFTGLSAGFYRVSATWPPAGNRPSNAPYRIRETASGINLQTAFVNQRVSPASFTADGSAWQQLGTVGIGGTQLVVQLTNATTVGYVMADAIRVERVSSLIIDDGQPGFSVSGAWTATTSGRDGDVRYAASGTGTSIATWTFTGLAPGQYTAAVTWPPSGNRSNNAPYRIRETAGAANLLTANFNQRLAPTSFTADGSSWQTLGTVTITGTTLVVQLTNNTSTGFVIADAVRLVRGTTLPKTTVPFTSSPTTALAPPPATQQPAPQLLVVRAPSAAAATAKHVVTPMPTATEFAAFYQRKRTALELALDTANE